MEYQPKNYKIYSRKRMNLAFFNNTPRAHKFRRKLKKIMPFCFSLIIAIATCLVVWNSINPIFEAICEDEAKSIATKVTNEETTKIMNQYNYDTFFTVEKDENGNVQMITANVLKVNQITSDIALNIQKALEDSEKNKIYISLGAITGIRILSGVGPKIEIKIASAGNVETDLRSEFVAQGVNQTIHRVYLDIKTNVKILTSFSTIQSSIENQVLIAENVILGEIPSTYYNFNGIENKDEVLDVVE